MNLPADFLARGLADGTITDTARPQHREDVDEAEFQAEVVRRAKQLGWDAYHPYYSQKSRAGYPDLTLWRERVVWMELKAETGRLRPDQMVVIDALRKAGAEVYVFRPRDWPQIESVLRTKKEATGA